MKSYLFLIALILLMPISIASPPFEKQSIDNSSVKQLIQQYENVKGKKLEVENYKIALPLSLKLVITDTNETIFLKFDKNGLLILPESMRKVDLEIKTTKLIFFEIAETSKNLNIENLKKYIENEKMEVVANSLKAQIATEVLEDKLGITIVKKKTFRARTLGFVASKFIGLFLKKNA